ncbi:MAG: bifunctional diguanylate cyclase/phosphodiesterase [Oscillospiraceae bacterium]|nr:bifunctional diguanylate cyclase/phosphodiesterase [Oscillospiraceae bacterium]
MMRPLTETSNRKARSYDQNLLITYDCETGEFTYPSQNEFRPIGKFLHEEGYASESTAEHLNGKIKELAASDTPQVFFTEYYLRNIELGCRWYRVGFILPQPHGILSITFTDIHEEIESKMNLEHRAEYDYLTGLPNHRTFCRRAEEILQRNPETAAMGGYAMIYFDVIRFKAINDMFGMDEGDKLLRHIADSILRLLGPSDAACRIGSDRFVVLINITAGAPEGWISELLSMVDGYGLSIQIAINAGIYVTCGDYLKPSKMIDRAILAQTTIKGSYTIRHHYYNESLRHDMLSEHEIVSIMENSLAESHFVVHFQPQYNHSTGMHVGAEALVRWNHPERGLISPALFIPIFEKNDFITKLDYYVFRNVCQFLKKCMDKNLPMIPISVNFSKLDIFEPNFVESIEAMRKEYGIPVRFLRLEITETAIAGDTERTNEVIQKLHDHGYIVEMDDFGSGYSSLNVLKDIKLDIIKMDMKFLEKEVDGNRGGTILSSVIRMAKWLNLPVIAEGVETVEQADFLRSIGCDCIQGYLYSRPLTEENYEALLSKNCVGAEIPRMDLIETLNAHDFWDPASLETLIFSNYVGGAAIFEFYHGKVEILRVNQKYLQEICMNLTEKQLIESDPLAVFDAENLRIYREMLERAIATGEEQECETWRTLSSDCCGSERICIRSNVRMIGRSDGSVLFYAMIRNITNEKNHYDTLRDSEHRFKIASEQVNIYYWEYTVATKEMRPCFRCMRDLDLPPLLTNYPEPMFERGIFPMEVYEMYNDWHRQIEKGATNLEAVIPLTAARVPYRIRYTTEFDENGNPVKAYGSAALVV